MFSASADHRPLKRARFRPGAAGSRQGGYDKRPSRASFASSKVAQRLPWHLQLRSPTLR